MRAILTLLALSFGLYSTSSSAQIFDLEVTDFGAAAGNATFENFVNAEIQKIETDINGDLPSAPPERLIEGMANSSVLSAKGVGQDYVNDFKIFIVGAGLGVGADMEEDKNTDSDLSGAAVAPSVMVGTNLSWMSAKRFLGMDTDRLKFFLNFMSYSKKQELEDKPGQESDAKIDAMTLGAHFRYDWIKGSGPRLARWGGVKFTFGYEYNKNDIDFNGNITETVNQTSATSETINGTITGNPVATIETSTHSIPVAISTDVRLLWILSLYTGLGADFNFGKSEGKGDLNADDSTLTCTGGACGGGTSVTVRARANIDADAKPDSFTSRAFAGAQINLPYTRIFVQVDKALGNDLIGATAGLRFLY